MDSLIMNLANFGAMGSLCAVLFYLLRETIRTFKDEMREERAACERRHLELVTELRDGREANEVLHKTLENKVGKVLAAQEFNRMLIDEIGGIRRVSGAKKHEGDHSG